MKGNGNTTEEPLDTATVTDEGSPEYLMPQLDGGPVRELTTYRSLFFLDVTREHKASIRRRWWA